MIFMSLYTEKLTSGIGDKCLGNNGFLLRLLYCVSCGEKVAVAVPSKKWAELIENIMPVNKNVVRIDSSTTSIQEVNLNDPEIEVLIYTSKISAGHSIDIKNHYSSVFLVVSGVDRKGVWHTPSVGEMIQMSARVRNPITPDIYVTVDSFHNTKRPLDRIPEVSFKCGKMIHCDLFESGNNIFAQRLSLLTQREFFLLVLNWLTTKAYPGSDIEERILTEAMCNNIILDNLGKLAANTEKAKATSFIHGHEAAHLFMNQKTLKRKKVPKCTFNMYPDLKKIKVGENRYVVDF